MAVTYPTSVKNARLNAVVTAMGATAVLEIGTASMASILAVIELDDPAATVSGGVMTFAGFPKSDTTANNSGTAAAARIRTSDADGNDVVTGLTVGTSGADIILDSVAITAGQVITINSASITHAP